MPKINSLYELIKQRSQELGRPLKVISDWDETLFSFRSNTIYKSAKISMPFKEFFKEFWENASVEAKGQNALKVFDYNGTNEEIKKAHQKFLELEEERKKDPHKNSDKWQKTNTVDVTPLLSIGEDIKRCLEEGLISKLVVVTTTRNSTIDEPSIIVLSKRERMARTFGKFPQSELGIMMVKKINGVNKPHRWEWIKENHPDFDMFIDDDIGWVKSVREHFPGDKIYALPDYKNSFKFQGDNIYHVKQEVSDLKDEDFEVESEKIYSLYEIIKQKSQEKGRPLKIVCDWDDCIQPFWPWIIFENSPDKNNLDKFPEYFEAYFNESNAINKEAVEFVKKIKKENSLEKYYEKSAEAYGMKERHSNVPFTTIAEDLLKSLKEGLIDKLLIITSFSYEGEKDKTALWTCSSNNGKFEKFLKTFGKFPGSFFELTELKKNEEGKYVPRRWERIEKLFSNFDVYIDDRSDYILEACDFFSSDKTYVLPSYEKNKNVQVTNIYHLETGISSLRNKDFIFDEKPTKKNKENEQIFQLQTEMQQLEIIDDKTSQQAQIEVSKQFAFLKK